MGWTWVTRMRQSPVFTNNLCDNFRWCTHNQVLELQSSFLNDSILHNHLEKEENKTHILASSELLSEKGSSNFSGPKKLLQCNI